MHILLYDSFYTKAVKEKELDQAFVRAMNHVIGGREAFMDVLVRLNAKSDLNSAIYDKEYSALAADIELMRERRKKLKMQKLRRFCGSTG